MAKKRIVVTGMGIVSCFGTDIDLFYDSLLQGKSGITPIRAFDASSFPTRFAGEVPDFDVEGYLDKKQARRVDPFIRYTIYGGKRALESAGIPLNNLSTLDRRRCGIIIGSGMGGMKTFYEGVETLKEKGLRRLTPFFIPHIITNMGGAMLGIDLGFEGPNYSISTACATSNYCIVAAADHIRKGDADLILCGGAEAPIGPIGLGGFVAIKALSERNEECQKASRPWDKSRDGFVMGEGAGVLVLETLEHAKKRGATIYAEYLGGATACDAYHMTDPREDGAGVARCIELAIKEAGIEKEQVNYVNAHATSTIVGDMCEIKALKTVFGSHAKNININSTKSMTGHCLGAAAGIEAIATIKAILTHKLHPTINLDNPEEELFALNPVIGSPRDCLVNAAISNSFGFGGHNSSIIFAPFKE
ncbi:MAG: beta-ketoacyl-ACP synthase II [Chlamydiales bacterium]|nr:beta-ketoacyl-ACP synthase II [Chlamydiales bacterium]